MSQKLICHGATWENGGGVQAFIRHSARELYTLDCRAPSPLSADKRLPKHAHTMTYNSRVQLHVCDLQTLANKVLPNDIVSHNDKNVNNDLRSAW